MVDFLISWGLPQWLATSFFLVWSVNMWRYSGFYEHEIPRKRWIGYLSEDTPSKFYKKFLGDQLDKLDRAFSSRELDLPLTSARRAWSRGLIDATMLLAITFPIAAFLLQWVFTNTSNLGNVAILPPVAGWIRIATICGFASSLILMVYSIKSKGPPRLASIVLAAAFLLGIAVFFRGQPFASAVLVAFGVAGAFAGRGAGAFTLAGPFAVTVAVVFAVAISVAVAVAFAVEFLVAFVSAVSVAGAFTVAVISAFAFVDTKRGERIQHTLFLVGIMFAGIAVAVILIPAFPDSVEGDAAKVLLLFVGIFPLVNAIADFASIGFTRWKLRIGLAGNMPLQAFWDFVVAILIFALLGMVLILTIHLLRTQDGQPLLDLTAFFADINAHPENYWWLSFTFIWTLLPTFAHACIAAFSLFTFIPAAGHLFVAGLLEQSVGDPTKGRPAVGFISLGVTLAFCVPVALIWVALELARDSRLDIVHFIIAGFESFARWIGAV